MEVTLNKDRMEVPLCEQVEAEDSQRQHAQKIQEGSVGDVHLQEGLTDDYYSTACPRNTANDSQMGEKTSDIDLMFEKCKQLALNKEFHSVLINDPVFCPFLILCMDASSKNDVFRALEIFNLLALNPDAALGLSKVIHFYDGLEAAAKNQSLSNEVREFAISISNTVKSSLNVPKTKGKPTVKNTQAGEQSQAQGKRNQSFAKGKAVELYIPLCIFKEKRLKMTEALLRLKGIISITYDMKKCYCMVRGKSHLPNELYGITIANLGFECHLVSRFENKEVLTQVKPDPKLGTILTDFNKKENVRRGRKSLLYLSDSESEISFQEDKAVASKEKTIPQKGAKGWLSSAANFLQKSFYW